MGQYLPSLCNIVPADKRMGSIYTENQFSSPQLFEGIHVLNSLLEESTEMGRKYLFRLQVRWPSCAIDVPDSWGQVPRKVPARSWPAPAEVKVCKCRGCVLGCHPSMEVESPQLIPLNTMAGQGSQIPPCRYSLRYSLDHRITEC